MNKSVLKAAAHVKCANEIMGFGGTSESGGFGQLKRKNEDSSGLEVCKSRRSKTTMQVPDSHKNSVLAVE